MVFTTSCLSAQPSSSTFECHRKGGAYVRPDGMSFRAITDHALENRCHHKATTTYYAIQIDPKFPIPHCRSCGQSLLFIHSPLGPKRGLEGKWMPFPRGRPSGTEVGFSGVPALHSHIHPNKSFPISCSHICLIVPNFHLASTARPPHSSFHFRFTFLFSLLCQR